MTGFLGRDFPKSTATKAPSLTPRLQQSHAFRGNEPEKNEVRGAAKRNGRGGLQEGRGEKSKESKNFQTLFKKTSCLLCTNFDAVQRIMKPFAHLRYTNKLCVVITIFGLSH